MDKRIDAVDILEDGTANPIPLLGNHLVILLFLSLLGCQFPFLIIFFMFIRSHSHFFSHFGLYLCRILHGIRGKHLHQVGQPDFGRVRREQTHFLAVALVLKLGLASLAAHLFLLLFGEHQTALRLFSVHRCRDGDGVKNEMGDERVGRGG